MTHDELLAKIITPIVLKAGIQETDIVNVNLLVKKLSALRAVVELHKPDKSGKYCQAHDECWGCGEWGTDSNCFCDKYPCPTIQTIKKELA